MRINGQNQTLSTTSHHNSKRARNIKGADIRVLVLMSHLIVILPHLVEVEWIKELNRAVESSHYQSDILDILQLGNRFLNCLRTADS